MPWQDIRPEMATEHQKQFLCGLEISLYGEVRTDLSTLTNLTKQEASKRIECELLNYRAMGR